MFERTDPKTLKKWLLLAAIVYFLLPFDLVPDLLGILGRIDDVAIIALLAWFYRNHLKQFVAAGSSRIDLTPRLPLRVATSNGV